MLSPRKSYPLFLHAALVFTTLFLGSFGILGLLRFGSGVDQIATQNLPEGSLIGHVVQGCLVVAILFTYPLQLFPVIETVEGWCFGFEGKAYETSDVQENVQCPVNDEGVSNPLVHVWDEEKPQVHLKAQDYSSLGARRPSGSSRLQNLVVLPGCGAVLRLAGISLDANGAFDAMEVYGPIAGKSLRRTVALRIALVIVTSVVATVAADFYGYIGSIVGAVGATTLSFIMPCLLHLSLFRDELDWSERLGDVATVAVGFLSGVVGLALTFQQIITG